MTFRCASDHPPILHDEFHCPLCALQGDWDDEARWMERKHGVELDEAERALQGAQKALQKLEAAYDDLAYAIECEDEDGLLETLRIMVERQRKELAA